MTFSSIAVMDDEPNSPELEFFETAASNRGIELFITDRHDRLFEALQSGRCQAALIDWILEGGSDEAIELSQRCTSLYPHLFYGVLTRFSMDKALKSFPVSRRVSPLSGIVLFTKPAVDDLDEARSIFGRVEKAVVSRSFQARDVLGIEDDPLVQEWCHLAELIRTRPDQAPDRSTWQALRRGVVSTLKPWLWELFEGSEATWIVIEPAPLRVVLWGTPGDDLPVASELRSLVTDYTGLEVTAARSIRVSAAEL